MPKLLLEEENFIDKLSKEIYNRLKKDLPKKWLRSSQVREMLSISDSTLAQLRVNGDIPSVYLSTGTWLYPYDGVVNALKSKVKDGSSEPIFIDLSGENDQLISDIVTRAIDKVENLQTKKWLRTRNVCEMLSISESILLQLRNKGEIHGKRTSSGTWIYDYDEIVYFLESRTKEGNGGKL